MKISACVIVKNEEKNLPRWLNCVKQLADEIIVVDTGSTDRTVELARAAGAKLYYFAWIKDFAAAKNYALEQATGEWIINLDADEYFPDEDCPEVLALIRRYHPDRRVGGFLCRRIDIDPDRDNKYLDDVTVLRVFRNSCFLRYEGKIHELLTSHAKRKPEMKLVPNIKILHTGYAASLSADKARRNLDILLAEQKRRGELPADNFYLADCYASLGEYDKAITYARRTIEARVRFLGMSNHPYLLLIRLLIAAARPAAEVDEAIASARERFPKLPEFPMMAGLAAWQRKEYLQAEKELRQGLALYHRWQEEPNRDVYVGDQATNLLPEVYDDLGQLAMMRGDIIEAGQCLTMSLKERRSDDRLARLCHVLRSLPPTEAIVILNQLYDMPQEAALLARKLYAQRLPKACLYYERQAGERIYPDFDRYIFAGKALPGAALAADTAAALARLGGWLRKTGAEEKSLALLLPPAEIIGEAMRMKRLNGELTG